MNVMEMLKEIVTPVGIVWAFLILAGITNLRRMQKGMGIAMLIAALVLAVIGNSGLAEHFASKVDHPYESLELEEDGGVVASNGVDVVVVMNWDGAHPMKPQDIHASMELPARLDRASNLVRGGNIAQLVIPNLGSTDKEDPKLCQWMQAGISARLGVDPQNVVSIPLLDEVHDQAKLVAELAKIYQWKSIQLVTSSVEMQRTVSVFQKLGLDVTPVACERLSPPKAVPGGGGWIPNADAVGVFAQVIKEKWAYESYKFRGWI